MAKTPEPIDLTRLPPDIRVAVEALQAQVDDFREANARLEHLVKELHQALYGKKSKSCLKMNVSFVLKTLKWPFPRLRNNRPA